MSREFYEKEMEMFRKQAKEFRMIITTVAIPCRSALKLVMKDEVDSMQAGSVIDDLAGTTDRNCELTKPGEMYVYNNRVAIIGKTGLISSMSWQSSSMYANNMASLMDLRCPKPQSKERNRAFKIDMTDQVIRGMTVVKDGEITWPPPENTTKTSAAPKTQSVSSEDTEDTAPKYKKPLIFSKRVFELASVGNLCIVVFGASFFGVVVCVPVSLLHTLWIPWLLFDMKRRAALFSPLMSTEVVILRG